MEVFNQLSRYIEFVEFVMTFTIILQILAVVKLLFTKSIINNETKKEITKKLQELQEIQEQDQAKRP